MHDPMTVAFEIRSPFRDKPTKHWPEGYRQSLVTIWHCDPERDGSDDSCGWFMRSRHGDPKLLEGIRSDFDFHWDADHGGWFNRDGTPYLSPMGIALQMFNVGAWIYFNRDRRKRDRFLSRHLLDILLFAENNVDSLHSSVVMRFGHEERKSRIEHFSHVIYGCILRWERPWWRHPKWHVHHWRFQVHHYQAFLRWTFTRCAVCGGRFRWGETGVGTWDGKGPRWFRSEDLKHMGCSLDKVPGQVPTPEPAQ